MTSKEAFLLIRRIEGKFGCKYDNADLGRVWPEIITFPLAVAQRAVGECFMIWQRPPEIDEVVKAIRKSHMREELNAVELARPEGEAMFAVLNAFLAGTLSEQEYISALYAASDQFKNPDYAKQAHEREQNLKAANG